MSPVDGKIGLRSIFRQIDTATTTMFCPKTWIGDRCIGILLLSWQQNPLTVWAKLGNIQR